MKIEENIMRQMILQVLQLEKRNLRSKAKTDQKMVDEIIKIISEYAKMTA